MIDSNTAKHSLNHGKQPFTERGKKPIVCFQPLEAISI